MGNVHVVGPNEVLVISGGCRCPKKKIIAGGGCVWTWYVGNKVQIISLALMTLMPTCVEAETIEGVPITVSGVAHCKISKKKRLLRLAVEQFLDRSAKQIAYAIQLTLEGHLRAILGTLKVEEVYKDREKFAFAVWEVAAVDLAGMGVEIVTFTIRDICDNVLYLSSLGKTQTAQVKRDANISVAEAERDAGIKESQCNRITMVAKYESYTKIADNYRKYQLQKMDYDIEINAAKADAHLAYELQATKIQQRIKFEEMQIDVVEKQKQIEIEEQEIFRKELELVTMVRLTTEAELYKRKVIGQGKNYQIIQIAKAEMEKVRSIGFAEAHIVQMIGTVNAERNRLKALVFQNYEEAAITSLILEALPKIAAEVSAPLARTDEIVLLGNRDHLNSTISQLFSQFPPSSSAWTGVDLSKVLSNTNLINYLQL